MKSIRIVVGFLLSLVLFLTIYPVTASAVSYDLIAPEGTLTRGQEVQFIIDIDSQASTLSTAQVGMTYQSQFVQFISATPGDAMVSVTAVPVDASTVMLTGSNSSGFNGTGVFAYVTFKIIADAPGSTELCALFSPSTTPSPVPTVAGVTPTVVPTQLPVTGTVQNTQFVTILGTAILLSSLASLSLLRRTKSSYVRKKH